MFHSVFSCMFHVIAADMPIERASIDEMFIDVSAHCAGDAAVGAKLAERGNNARCAGLRSLSVHSPFTLRSLQRRRALPRREFERAFPGGST